MLDRLPHLLFASALLIVPPACTSGGEDTDEDGGGDGGYTADDVADQNLQGVINGTAWELIAAEVEVDHWDETKLGVDLYGEDVETCGWMPETELPFILFSIPGAVGEYPLSLFGDAAQTATFVLPPADNYIATQGIIVIEELTETSVTLGMNIEYDADFSVDGKLTVDLCADDTGM